MLALFTLYLQNPDEGFGWSAERATNLYANYMMFVYASPLIGGWIADRKLGYRRCVMIGGFFFMAGHLLLSFRSIPIVYLALTCLVIGNGGWFVATAIGNKLTMIGVYWERWLHSTFFAMLGGMALAMAVVLLFLLRPLKRAMPGV